MTIADLLILIGAAMIFIGMASIINLVMNRIIEEKKKRLEKALDEFKQDNHYFEIFNTDDGIFVKQYEHKEKTIN